MATPDRNKLGFIGVGQIGLPMAQRLQQAGNHLTVFDVRVEATNRLPGELTTVATSPRVVADRCEIVCLSLPSLHAFRNVIVGSEGIIHGRAVRIVVNTSTVGMPVVVEMAEELAKKGISMVDCPVSGGVPGALAATLSVMISGTPAMVEAVRPYVSCWGAVTVAGDAPGIAQVLKLTNQILSAVTLAATAEAFVMGAKAGVDPELMVAAINKGSGRSSGTMDKVPRSVLDRSFNYGATMNMLMKDIDLAIQQGEALGVPMWVCQAARLVYKHAINLGAGPDDVTTIVRHVEAGAQFQIPKTR